MEPPYSGRYTLISGQVAVCLGPDINAAFSIVSSQTSSGAYITSSILHAILKAIRAGVGFATFGIVHIVLEAV